MKFVAAVNTQQLCAVLWEDSIPIEDQKMKLRHLLSDLARTLQKAKTEEIFSKQRNSFAVDPDPVELIRLSESIQKNDSARNIGRMLPRPPVCLSVCSGKLGGRALRGGGYEAPERDRHGAAVSKTQPRHPRVSHLGW
ncbi:MAG: hypothetical protein ACOX66_04815 [Oscillospiraceae bacterium]|jgi:hypothetical protein